MKTLVTFRSDVFNTSEPRDYFINPECFGDDVAKWLSRELHARGVETIGEPGQEDFGWYLTFRVDNIKHWLVIGFRPGDGDAGGDWVGWIERARGPIGSVILGGSRGIRPTASWVIHEVLAGSPRIRDVRWHDRTDFDCGREEFASPEP